MKRNRALFLLTVVSAIWFTSCSHGQICQTCCVGTCINNDATLGVTISAIPLTPPPGTSILSYSFTVTGISLTPTTGSDINIPIAAVGYIFDGTKLQSDSAVVAVGTASTPAGTYTKMTIAVSNAAVTYCTQPSPGTPGCAAGSMATVVANPLISTPSAPLTLTLAAHDLKGVRLELNMGAGLTFSSQNSQVITGLTLAPAAGTILTATPLPPATSSLATGQLDFVEDFTGIVTGVTGNAVTVTTTEHGVITALSNSSTSFSPNCMIAGIGTAEDFTHCVTVGQLASIDTTLNADGTFTLLEYDPLEAVASDWIEGTVTSTPGSTTQFQIVPTDIFLKGTGSLIGATLIHGTPVTVNLRSVANGGVQFSVDSKGLTVPQADANLFTSANDTSLLKPGQTVAMRVTSFTPASGSVFASVVTDAVMLRFTRVTGTVLTSPGPSLSFSINNLPPYFGLTVPAVVQLNQAVFPSSAGTNYDGVTDASGLRIGDTVSIRAIYFPTSTTQTFSAAKVRKQ